MLKCGIELLWFKANSTRYSHCMVTEPYCTKEDRQRDRISRNVRTCINTCVSKIVWITFVLAPILRRVILLFQNIVSA